MDENTPTANTVEQPNPAALSGVAAQAAAGALESTPNAGVATDAPAPQQAGSAPTETTTTADILGAVPGNAPAATDILDQGPDTAANEHAAAVAAARAEVQAQFNAIEQTALFWGGETGIKIRNHVGRLRQLMALLATIAK